MEGMATKAVLKSGDGVVMAELSLGLPDSGSELEFDTMHFDPEVEVVIMEKPLVVAIRK